MDKDSDPPVERVIVDQIVAANVRRWRRAAGMTQEQLGRKMGWSAANVSAAERSADPARDPRRFDAQTLALLSIALSVPLIALFFPPDDDGERVAYMFSGPGGEHDMTDLMALVVMTDSDDDAPVMGAYRNEFDILCGRYLDPSWHEKVALWLSDQDEAGRRLDRAERLRAAAASLRAEQEGIMRGAAELEAMADALDRQGGHE